VNPNGPLLHQPSKGTRQVFLHLTGRVKTNDKAIHDTPGENKENDQRIKKEVGGNLEFLDIPNE